MKNETTNLYSDVVAFQPRLIACTLGMSCADAIIQSFDAIEEHSDNVQLRMIELLDNLSNASRKSIVESEDLVRIFSHRMRGIDRGSLVAWVQEYTPIRIKFHSDTGRFDKLGWSVGHVKTAKKEEKPVFDLEGLIAVHWAEFAPERTRHVKAGSFQKAIKNAANETARVAFDAGINDRESMKEAFMAEMAMRFDVELMDVLNSEKHAEWCEKRTADKADKAALEISQGRGQKESAEKVKSEGHRPQKQAEVTYANQNDPMIALNLAC